MQILQIAFNGLAFGATLALVSIGLTLVFGILRIVNFAHGAMYMLGAYATYYFVTSYQVNYFLAIPAAAVVLGLLGALLGATLFRRFRGLMLEGAIAAIALTLLIQDGGYVVLSAYPRQVHGGFTGVIELGGVRMITQRIFVIVVATTLVAALHFFVTRTRYGRAMRAVQQDPYVAQLQGISIDRITIVTFALGGALAGIAGALIAPEQVLLPSMGEGALLLAFVAIIVGGMGSVNGALIAAMAIGFVQSAVSTYWLPQAATWVSFAIALTFLTFRPRGLLGHA